MTICISYPLSRKSPLYPNTPPMRFETVKSLKQGDSSNTTMISVPSHAGTHLDLPSHFCPDGASAKEMLSYGILITPVCCCDIPKNHGDSLGINDFVNLNIPKDTRGLLVRTGYFHYRNNDPLRYTKAHPYVLSEIADFLREICPDIIVFGIDTISVSNPNHREIGQMAHRSFLCKQPPIMILEDLDLSRENLNRKTWKLRIYPVFLDETDGTPVVALLE